MDTKLIIQIKIHKLIKIIKSAVKLYIWPPWNKDLLNIKTTYFIDRDFSFILYFHSLIGPSHYMTSFLQITRWFYDDCLIVFKKPENYHQKVFALASSTESNWFMYSVCIVCIYKVWNLFYINRKASYNNSSNRSVSMAQIKTFQSCCRNKP